MGAITERLDQILRAYSDQRMRELGVVAVQYAQYLVPVRTGTLQKSIRYDYDAGTKTLRLIADSRYGLFVEFGTYKMKARPYIRPALEAVAKILSRALAGGSENLAMDFRNVAPIKNPEILAYPRNARHAAIMRSNRATSVGFNRGTAGQARQFIHHRRAR